MHISSFSLFFLSLGSVTETNAFGTHDFFDLCEEIGCELVFSEFDVNPECEASARILSSESIRDHNTFTAPETVVIRETPVTADKNTITIIVPAHSVVSLSVE